MALEESSKTALNKLGLTEAQVRVYLTVVKLGTNVTIRTIANAEKADRANLYRTIAQLHQIGLVQVTLGTPNTYRALSIQDGIELLLSKRTEEFDRNRRHILDTLDKVRQQTLENYTICDDTFQIAPGGGAEVVFVTAHNNAQTSVDAVFKSSDLIRSCQSDIDKQRSEMLKRGVDFRWVLFSDKKIKLNKIFEKADSKKWKGSLRIKFVNYPPEAAFAILDRSEVFIHTKPILPDWVGTPCFRTNNVCLVGVIQKYFETLWSEAKAQNVRTYVHRKRRSP